MRDRRATVIIPFHRHLGPLRACLAALAESVADFELIVAADGAIDDCVEVARACGAAVVVLPQRSGPAAARNRAAARARGELLVFVDADVVPSSDAVRGLCDLLDREPAIAGVFGAYDRTPAAANFVSQFKNLSHAYVHEVGNPRAATFWAGLGAVRADAFAAVGGFDERFTRPSVEDIDLGYRLVAAGFALRLDPAFRGTHLKRWTFWSCIVTDIRARGIPWTQLILRYRALANDLNTSRSLRASVAFSSTAGTPVSNFIYHGWPTTSGTMQQNANYRAAMSYVTGSHSLKVGYQGAYMIAKTPTFLGQQISYRFNNGVPNQLTQRIGQTLTSNRTVPTAFFVQDQWTRNRLTLQGGLRYEHVRSFFPEGENGVIEAHRFGPAFTFPRTEGVRGYNDLTPRMGASYDLFGTGRTAIKLSMSKYLQAPFNGDVYTINNPAVTLVATTSRGWTDANRDFVADCDFMNPAANGECQAWTNLNWGQPGQGTQVNPDVQEGWGKRNWDWQFSAGVQHELLPRVSVDVSYSRRWWGNFFVTHNRALGPQDYDEVTLTAPTDSRLPGGGGYPVNFLVRNNNSVLGVSDPYYTTTKDFGDETHYWHGMELTVNARLNNGLLFQGGTSTGRGVNDTCDVLIGRYGRPMSPGNGIIDGQPDCSASEPWITTVRGLASYTVPKIDVLVSAIMRSQGNVQPGGDVATNGASRSANYLMNAAQFLAATGRPLRTGVTTETINLLLPGQIYGERVNNLDMRIAKVVRVKGTRANIGLDLYNLTNANTPSAVEATYDPATNGERWLRPTTVVQPRFMRVNVQFDF